MPIHASKDKANNAAWFSIPWIGFVPDSLVNLVTYHNITEIPHKNKPEITPCNIRKLVFIEISPARQSGINAPARMKMLINNSVRGMVSNAGCFITS
jgi:hypothetical protein